MSQQTPTPWIARNGDILVETEKGQETIATTYPMNHIQGESDSNAAFIVRAVNSHEALLKQLRVAQERFLCYAKWIDEDGFRNAINGRPKMTKNEMEIMKDAKENADEISALIAQSEGEI
jgi:hypothetical protein